MPMLRGSPVVPAPRQPLAAGTLPCMSAPAYNKDQWIESFEGQLGILRPHLTGRPLSTLSMAAWRSVGVNGVEPITAARQLSALLDQQQAQRSQADSGPGR